jgi:hypothetical protein
MNFWHWGGKTLYYSLINKQGAKASVEDSPRTADEQKMWNALNATGNVPVAEEFDDDCEACKL